MADNTGRLYIADGGNDRVLIYKSIPTVERRWARITCWASRTSFRTWFRIRPQLITSTVVSNNSSANTMRAPSSLAWDGTNLYVTDPYDLRVLYFTPGDPSLVLPNDSVLNAASMQIHAEGYVVIALIRATDHERRTPPPSRLPAPAIRTRWSSGDTLQTIADGLVSAINSSNSGAGDPNVIAVSVPGAHCVAQRQGGRLRRATP